MPQDNNITQLSKEEIIEEELEELVKKAMEQGKEESLFFLKLSTFKNICYPDRVYEEKYQLLFGEVTEVVTYEMKDTCTVDREVVLIPKTKAVVVMYYDGFGNPAILYTFSVNRGWTSIFL